MTLATLLPAITAEIKKSNKAAKIQPPQPTTLGGKQGYSIRYSMTESGVGVALQQVMAVHNDKLYIVTYGSAASDFNSYSTDFADALKSFAFTG